MKKVALVLAFCFWTMTVSAQMPYIEEVRALGAISGQGLACGSTKFDTFELLARAILLTKSPTDKLQNDAIYAYSEAKANAYMSKEMDGFFDCASINRRFDNQEIFKATLYADGTIKMPDGQILTPRTPYDATMIYKKDNKIRENAKAIYNGSEAKIVKVDVKDSTVSPERAALIQSQPLVQAPTAASFAPQQRPVSAPAPLASEAELPPTSIKHISRRR